MNSSTFLAVALLATPVAAQAVSLEFTPDPAPPGVAVTITGTNATAADIVLSSPCGWLTIHRGSQTGPVVGPNLSCPAVLVGVPPGGAFRVQWDQRDPNGALVLPGNY